MERRVILNRLAGKYEVSSHLLHPGQSRRRVMLRVDRKELPEYQYEDAATRDAYNAAARGLEEDGLIQLEWVPDRQLMTRLVLNLDTVERVYAELGRPHPARRALSYCEKIRGQTGKIQTEWIKRWADEACQTAERTYRIPPNYAGDTRLLDDLLRAFAHYDALKGQAVSLRAFSIQCYQDSKRFEREIQGEFLRIARKYDAELAELCLDEDVREREQLSFLGLLARPELFELSGRIAVETEGGAVDLAPLFPCGIALPSTQFDRIRRFQLDSIRTVTFIENKTNYDIYLQQEIREDELVVYQGGFLSPSQKKLCQLIAAALRERTAVRFWADIDLGGFRMFEQLAALFPNLSPFRMSPEDVAHYKEHGLARSERYLATLEQLLRTDRYPRFSEVIRALLDGGVTIEQEVFYSV